MQYIVGANCFAPKIYCIQFAVGKKSRKTSPSGKNNHFFKYIVSYCRSWMHKETIRKEIFLRENFISQVGKLTCNCNFAVAIVRDLFELFFSLSILSPSRRREAPCEGTNSPRLFTPGETKALAKSKVHQISRA